MIKSIVVAPLLKRSLSRIAVAPVATEEKPCGLVTFPYIAQGTVPMIQKASPLLKRNFRVVVKSNALSIAELRSRVNLIN